MAESTLETLRRLDFFSALAVETIALERLRQIEQEGWSVAHDDEHASGEMASAAACYAQRAGQAPNDHRHGLGYPPSLWPWDAKWWKPKTPHRDLTRAGALAVAEIARRLRAAEERSLQNDKG